MVQPAFRKLTIILLAVCILAPLAGAQSSDSDATVRVTPEGSPVPVEPGSVAGIRLDLTNLRSTSVSNVRLDFVSPEGWTATFDLQGFELEGDETRSVRILVDVPENASVGDHPATVVATGGLNQQEVGRGELTLRIPTPEAPPEDDETFRVLAGLTETNTTRGAGLNLTFSLANPGDTSLRLMLGLRKPSHLALLAPLPESVDVPPESTHAVTLNLRVADTAPEGDTYLTLTAYGPADDGHANTLVRVLAEGAPAPGERNETQSTEETDASNGNNIGTGSDEPITPTTTRITPDFEIQLEPPEIELPDGAQATGILYVRNTGDIPLTVRISTEAPSPEWTVLVENADGVYVPAGGATDVEYAVRSPSAIPAGEAAVTFRGAAEDVTRTASLRVLTTPLADAAASSAEEASEPEPAAGSPLEVAADAWGVLYAQHGALAVAGAAAVAGAGTGGVYFLGTEAGRRKLWWIGAGLYTRLTKPTLLDHPERERLYNMIQENPGLHFHGLKRELGWNTGTLTYHLRVLERHRMIASRKDQLMRRFYAQGDQPNHVPRRTQVGGLRGEVLEVVREHGEVQQADLTDILGQTKQTINYHVKNLERMGLIEVEKIGRNTVLRPLDEDDDGPGAVSGPVPPFKDQLRKSGVDVRKLR